MRIIFVTLLMLSVLLVGQAHAQRQLRQHTVNQSDGVDRLVPANKRVATPPQISIMVDGNQRVIRGNGIPDHAVGAFPNQGNPHEIESQRYLLEVPANPTLSGDITPLGMHNFGIAVNGIPFDPGAAEWYLGNRDSGWQYEALSGAVALGVDDNHAHVQPTGAYHYHGMPSLLLSSLGVNASTHSPVIGWAADGFPIYALYGFSRPNDAASQVGELRSSYRLKSGNRPEGPDSPGGVYDGTFLNDYQYVYGAGELDECNGRMTVTPEFPEGTYAYFLTKEWPVIPRCYKGTPSETFTERSGGRRPSGGDRPQRHQHPHPHHGPPTGERY